MLLKYCFFRKHLVVLLKYSSVREGELGHFNYTSVMYLFVMPRERERNVMNWVTFHYACVYVCICDAQHCSVTVH